MLLIDKTGTLTLGQPQVTDIVPLNERVRRGAAAQPSAESYSEHPLAEALPAAAERKLSLADPVPLRPCPASASRRLSISTASKLATGGS